ncbi:siderophore ABC transporter substrate-binding protein [Enterovibrio norvegicus]|uniref:Siderophore ABC transporter substrate-binding protein n=1 Tax=Enterovibrio norvegicus TaxID=188144 RepID=A0ABV4L4N7_9GAMM|nr:siderophore ABC transporter substrate-binding protein [Enterovibrio norvegicus]OEF56040.1 enterochelin ABC transporter substrate-binding protein [Enterovibrio norvegicus]
MKTLFKAMVLSIFASFSAHAHNITIDHLMGQTQIDGTPEKVVVIGLGSLDAVNALGIDPVAVSKVSQTPNYLDKYKSDKYANAGSLFEPNFEEIYMQEPDLIIVGPRSSTSYEELSKIAPVVVFANNQAEGYWEGTKEQWRNLGKIFSKEDLVEQKIASLEKEFNAIRQHNSASNSDALTVMSSGGNITAFGPESRFSVIYKDFGFKETVKDIKTATHGDSISFEFIREANPKTLLIIDRDTLINPADSTTREDFDNDLVKSTQAYKTGKMTYLDLNAWYLSMSGITATEQMVSDIKNSVAL